MFGTSAPALKSSTAPRSCTAQEIRVCTNRTCKRQGSQQVLKHLKDLTAGSAVTVQECGCLGNCGSGPNVALLPQEKILLHVATPADAAEVLSSQCGVEITPEVLKATQLRSAGNSAAMQGNLHQAIQLYSQGLAAGSPTGNHLLHSNRSAALLQVGKKEEALEDATASVDIAPDDFTMGWVRLIDCLYALGKYEEATAALKKAKASCIGFKNCPEYPSLVQALNKRSK